jgi:hypothetical protein
MAEKLGNLGEEYKHVHKEALEKLQAYKLELENKKTPTEKANDVKQRLDAQRTDYCLVLEAVQAAQNAYVEAQNNLQRAEARATQAEEAIADLETEWATLEAQAFPKAVAPGEQVAVKTRIQMAYDVMEECFGAELSRDQSVWSTMAELAGQVEKYMGHVQAKKDAARPQPVEAAGAATAGTPSQDSPPGPGHHRIIPEDAPWIISTGTKAHAHLINGSSVDTQRFVLEFFQKKQGKSKGKGKGKGKTSEASDSPTPAEARALFQARDTSNQAQTPGTPARVQPQPLGGLRHAAGGNPPVDPEQADMEVEKISGQRRKRDSEGEEENDDLGDRGSASAGGFPGGDGGGTPAIPPATAT